MKRMSVLAVCAALAGTTILASACKKDEPASETNTTSAPLTPDQPAVTPQTPSVDTGTVNDSTQPPSATTIQQGQTKAKGSPTTANGGTDMNASTSPNQTQTQNVNQPQPAASQQPNHSTPLGDGKSGTYTDGVGTHGGKATWGTGPQKNTKMDQPTP